MFLTAFFGLVLAGCARAQTPAPAYQFSLATVDGGTVRLEDMKGKVVFLDFWAGWCPPCRASIPSVKKLHEKYAQNKDFAVIGVNMENMETARKLSAEKNIKYISAVADDVTARRYGVRGIPTFIIIDKRGEISKRWVGFSESLYDEWVVTSDEALAYEPEPAKPAPKSGKSKSSSRKK
jgi:thiol-disulfide isomerase/thioredoxin